MRPRRRGRATPLAKGTAASGRGPPVGEEAEAGDGVHAGQFQQAEEFPHGVRRAPGAARADAPDGAAPDIEGDALAPNAGAAETDHGGGRQWAVLMRRTFPPPPRLRRGTPKRCARRRRDRRAGLSPVRRVAPAHRAHRGGGRHPPNPGPSWPAGRDPASASGARPTGECAPRDGRRPPRSRSSMTFMSVRRHAGAGGVPALVRSWHRPTSEPRQSPSRRP